VKLAIPPLPPGVYRMGLFIKTPLILEPFNSKLQRMKIDNEANPPAK
jgi:hypothetical protein